MLVDDEGWDAQTLQPGAEGEAALAAADDQTIGLLGAAERVLLILAALQP